MRGAWYGILTSTSGSTRAPTGKATVSLRKCVSNRRRSPPVDSGFENLFVLSGDLVTEKEGYAGSSGWLGNLRLNGEKIDLRDLMNTISVMRIGHHYPAGLGDLTNQLNELAGWLGLGVIGKVPYEPFIQNKRRAALP